MERYNPGKIERKWQSRWEKTKISSAQFPSKKKKFYTLVEFPYPSGEGLHVGHVKGQTAVDIYARYKRMNGFNVLNPMGWDAFGLPAENFAIKNKRHPAEFTRKNIKNFKRQIKSFYPSFDWTREIDTTDPKYYKWTQWIFLQLFKKGLAYEKEAAINWCPKDKTGLANEEVINGRCERCDTPVEKRLMRQWFLKITAYADRLIDDLADLDWPQYIKNSQINWIGKSEGAEVEFKVKGESLGIRAFTTRPDTLFGATYMVLAPEHELVQELRTKIQNWKDVEAYCKKAEKRSEIERTAEGKEKTGVELKGIKAINPANKREIPIWISDYVIATYGTGAIMAVPAHDERDYSFAEKFHLPITRVIEEPKSRGSFVAEIDDGDNSDAANAIRSLGAGKEHVTPVFRIYEISNTKRENVLQILKDAKIGSKDDHALVARGESFILLPDRTLGFVRVFTGDGIHSNSGFLNGLRNDEAIKKINNWLESNEFGKIQTVYRLRDWLFSRQRYWGEPIPIVKCGRCGNVPIAEKDLPLLLPKVKNYQPSGTGESPLANVKSWVNTKCPRCKGAAKRETNTMPQWAGSSWYFLRYIDPKNGKVFADPRKLKYFMPVDIYFGGAEHTTVHLLYSRFWNKVLFDLGLVPVSEPYQRRVQHGLILGMDNRKMSKRWGNVINPDDVIKGYGADTMRTYIMFMGPYGDSTAWSTSSIEGISRFMRRIWFLQERVSKKEKSTREMLQLLHAAMKKVAEDIEAVSYHTAVAQLMILVNHMSDLPQIPAAIWKPFLQLLAPFAPFIAEELWERAGEGKSIHLSSWPKYDKEILENATFELVIQVNGKIRSKFSAKKGISQSEAAALARRDPAVLKFLTTEPKKIIFVPDRLINFVV